MKCVATGKVRYRTEGYAEEQRTRRSGQTFGFEESRVYACPYCGGWHITTQVKEAREARVDRLLADYEKLGK